MFLLMLHDCMFRRNFMMPNGLTANCQNYVINDIYILYLKKVGQFDITCQISTCYKTFFMDLTFPQNIQWCCKLAKLVELLHVLNLVLLLLVCTCKN